MVGFYMQQDRENSSKLKSIKNCIVGVQKVDKNGNEGRKPSG